MKKLELDTRLILRNQHAIMNALVDILMAVPAIPRCIPLLDYQVKQTDEALAMNRIKDD